jgi:hypothetical protein
VQQYPLEDILVTPQIHTAHRSSLIQMGNRSFEQFSPPPHQLLATRATALSFYGQCPSSGFAM